MIKKTGNCFLIVFFLASCNTTKKSVYFRKMENTVIKTTIDYEAPIIQKNDLLSIMVSSLNPEASEVFNSTYIPVSHTSDISGTITQSFGYLVDRDGNIQFPILGTIKAEGLTQKALKDTIYNKIITKKLLIDPIINVRFLNFKISVMGEVEHPAVFNVPDEKITLLEALTLAGDMTIYARRDNVLLIREENGEKKIVRIDLSTAEIFQSPYYYLKTNDIIYVEPKKSKVATTHPIAPWISAIFSGTSVLIVFLTTVK